LTTQALHFCPLISPVSLAVALATPVFPAFISNQNCGSLIIRGLKLEPLDINNEAQLLRRFGRKTIANPYELTV
jgi:chromosome condensin MukBEF MukE localization factor